MLKYDLILLAGYIDLSKRRVSPEDITKCEERYMKSKTVSSILRHVASRLPTYDPDAEASKEKAAPSPAPTEKDEHKEEEEDEDKEIEERAEQEAKLEMDLEDKAFKGKTEKDEADELADLMSGVKI